MMYIVLSAIVSFAVTGLFGRVLLKKLRALKAGQTIREDGPTWHLSKQGTPTMGGLMFIVGIAAALLTVGIVFAVKGKWGHFFVMAFSLVYGAIGFLDDFQKVINKRNLGLTAKQKFLLQLVAAIAFVLLLRFTGYVKPNLYIPFFDVTVPCPEVVYLALDTFVIVGTVNAVNITDGVDGLATGVSLPVALCYCAVAVIWGCLELGVFAGALLGGLAAFLLFNFHPAKIFMGDTGSLFLGGAICALAIAMDMPLVLIPLGIVFIIETMSDILQVGYFKLTHGKRIFKMAPLHHHFEMCGWSEVKVFTVFTTVSALFAVLSYFGVFNRMGI